MPTNTPNRPYSETFAHRNVRTPKRTHAQNVRTPKRPHAETSAHRNVRTPKRQHTETPVHRNALHRNVRRGNVRIPGHSVGTAQTSRTKEGRALLLAGIDEVRDRERLDETMFFDEQINWHKATIRARTAHKTRTTREKTGRSLYFLLMFLYLLPPPSPVLRI